jgi:hypothetical protein
LEFEINDPTIAQTARRNFYKDGTVDLPVYITSMKNDEKLYSYQQIVNHYALFTGSSFADVRGDRSWWELFAQLSDLGKIPVRDINVNSISDISNAERGVAVARRELGVMYQQSFPSQKKTFVRDLKLNSCVLISGAAGTGKSFLLQMFKKYYRIHGYHVFKLAPTGVAAHNIGGQTIHRFFGITNGEEVANMSRLREHVEVYKKSILLIDEYSMISKTLFENVNAGLLKTQGETQQWEECERFFLVILPNFHQY